ncbi:MAG: TraB/GumN family protein [Chloroflexota bacterium]
MTHRSLRHALMCVLALVHILLFLRVDALAEPGKHFLWKVQSSSGTAYLLGSLHFLRRDAYPLPRSIEDAFDSSEILVVEANINDLSRVDVAKLLERAFYEGGDSLERHLSKETYDAARRRLEDNGLPPQLVNRQKPWYAALTLTSLELMKMGFDPNYGIDSYFLTRAGGRMKIVELESIDFQVDLLSGFSDREQELFLKYSISDLDLIRSEADTLLRVWRNGDVRGLESLLGKSAANEHGMSSIYEKLFSARNAQMTSKIEGLLRMRDTCFVIVGAGHLVGEKGILEALKRKGYSVHQL